MMKKILCGSVAAIALAGIASPAVAQTSTAHYASTAPIDNNPTVYNATNPSMVNAADAVLAQGVPLELGTRYKANADAPADSVPATDRVDVVFTLSGTVNRDCSFYAGNNADARNIDFGVIGVRTGNNENVNAAFEMVGPAEADIESLTAGCNTNNIVEINKDNVRGLVNQNPGGYDTNEFQANIPYTVQASWTGVALGAQTTGSPQSFTVGTAANAGALQQGAWRSQMNIDITAPVVNKGLVAGSYTGQTTLTLRAI